MNHTFELVEKTAGSLYLQCPDCSKAIRIGIDDGKIEVLRKGDFYAAHSWTTQGMSLTIQDVASCDFDECEEPATTRFGGDAVCSHHYRYLSHGSNDPL